MALQTAPHTPHRAMRGMTHELKAPEKKPERTIEASQNAIIRQGKKQQLASAAEKGALTPNCSGAHPRSWSTETPRSEPLNHKYRTSKQHWNVAREFFTHVLFPPCTQRKHMCGQRCIQSHSRKSSGVAGAYVSTFLGVLRPLINDDLTPGNLFSSRSLPLTRRRISIGHSPHSDRSSSFSFFPVQAVHNFVENRRGLLSVVEQLPATATSRQGWELASSLKHSLNTHSSVDGDIQRSRIAKPTQTSCSAHIASWLPAFALLRRFTASSAEASKTRTVQLLASGNQPTSTRAGEWGLRSHETLISSLLLTTHIPSNMTTKIDLAPSSKMCRSSQTVWATSPDIMAQRIFILEIISKLLLGFRRRFGQKLGF
eukprot:64349-Rhodomonas_salina.2